MSLLVLSCLSLLLGVKAFYLPGVPAADYKKGDEVAVYVEKLTSSKTQLPYDYYSIPLCAPAKEEHQNENLGEVLAGDDITNSPFQFEMQEPKQCAFLCRKTMSESDMELLRERIDDQYRAHLIIDNLPLATVVEVISSQSDEVSHKYDLGYDLGYVIGEEEGVHVDREQEHDDTSMHHYINNHLTFLVLVNQVTNEEGEVVNRIVGFEVQPWSVKHKYEGSFNDASPPTLTTCNGKLDQNVEPQSVDKPDEIIFTYDVEWKDSDIKWANRWEPYFESGSDKIHWFSIINSLMIVLFLSAIVAIILLRAINQDIARYNEVDDDISEETGWKLVHADVFRPPLFSPLLFSVCVGTGVQLCATSLAVILLGAFGFVSPANRGALATAILVIFNIMGVTNGLATARLYKMFGGKKWKRTTTLTATLYPGIIAGVVFFLNLFVWSAGSSGAIPFTTMIVLALMWLGISIPLVSFGAYRGFVGYEAVKNPVNVSTIPRYIPNQEKYMNPVLTCILGGILPFGAIFIETYFIMSSVWHYSGFYYLYGFLLLVFVILAITSAETAIIICYFQLCSEDWKWWWRSFFTSGSSAFYMLAYSLFYFVTQLEITQFKSVLLYFGYMWIVCLTLFLMTGTIGFLSCFLFVRRIYASIKVD